MNQKKVTTMGYICVSESLLPSIATEKEAHFKISVTFLVELAANSLIICPIFVQPQENFLADSTFGYIADISFLNWSAVATGTLCSKMKLVNNNSAFIIIKLSGFEANCSFDDFETTL